MGEPDWKTQYESLRSWVDENIVNAVAEGFRPCLYCERGKRSEETRDLCDACNHNRRIILQLQERPEPGTPEAMRPFWDVLEHVEKVCGNTAGRIHSNWKLMIEATIEEAFTRLKKAVEQ